MDVVRFAYNGGTPADSDTVNLFSTYGAGYKKDFFPRTGTTKFYVTIKNDQTGTIKEYRSEDGTTWTQIGQTSVAIPGSGLSNQYEYDVANYRHWKIDWVNGGTTQTTWTVDLAARGEGIG